MLRFIAIVISTSLLAACSLPQKPSEFKTWVKTASLFEQKTYVVDSVSMQTADSKLRGFAEKCFRLKTSRKDRYTDGSSVTWNSQLHPTITKGQDGAVDLIIQREEQNSIGFPKGGRYDIWVEIKPSGKGVQVFVAKYKGYGNIAEDFESWLQGKGQYCPSIF